MADPIELLIQGRAHELGPGFAVRRVLPDPRVTLDHVAYTYSGVRPLSFESGAARPTKARR